MILLPIFVSVTNKTKFMPEICRFFGIIIFLYWKDHNPPHIHFTYGDYVQFQYSYNSDEQQVDQNTKNINVTIPYIEVIKTGNVIVGNSKGEEEENSITCPNCWKKFKMEE